MNKTTVVLSDEQLCKLPSKEFSSLVKQYASDLAAELKAKRRKLRSQAHHKKARVEIKNMKTKYVQMQVDFEKFKSEYETLKESYDRLKGDCHDFKQPSLSPSIGPISLNTDYDVLKSDYEEMSRSYDGLKCEHEDLRREHEDLRREYEGLKANLTSENDLLNRKVLATEFIFSECAELKDRVSLLINEKRELCISVSNMTIEKQYLEYELHILQQRLMLQQKNIEALSSENTYQKTVIETFHQFP